jgi:diguanylate cyclase (GGDEF)-like protein
MLRQLWQRMRSGWLTARLSRRIVALFLGLLLVVQAISFLATRHSISRNARIQIAQELEFGERVFRQLLAQNAQKLSDGASLLVSDYGFRSAVATNDTDTIASVLLNHGERIGASFTLLLDTRFALRAAWHPEAVQLMPVLQRLAQRIGEGRNGAHFSDIVATGEHAYQLVMVPLRAPLVIGWVVMGFDSAPALVRNMRDISALQVSLLVRAGPSEPWQMAASTLQPSQTAVLAQTDWSGRPHVKGQAQSMLVAGEEFSVRSFVLDPEGGGNIRAVLMSSVDEVVARYRQLQLALGLLTVLGVAVFAAGSVLTARRITTPVRALVRAAEGLGRGDYQTPVQVHSPDEIGELAQAFERMRRNVEAKQREITHLAYWDSLTGLPNRAQFRLLVAAALAEVSRPSVAQANRRRHDGQGHVSVLMLDMDRFKHVNDVLGYEIGDRLLQQVAQRLGQVCLRQSDRLARLSGDEFAFLLAHTDAQGALDVAKRVAAIFEEPLVLDDQTIDLRASIGVASSPDHANDADTLLNRAEVAMYAAKRSSAGALVYDASLDSASARTISLLSELRRAIEEGQLRLVLQPKASLRTARVEGAEALVRWQHPQRGLVPPMEFIPFAEQTGFIRVLTAWILDECLRTWRLLSSQGRAVPLSVNLSTRDLMDVDLPQKLEALLLQHAAPAQALCLEITESAIMDDPARAQHTLERLHAMGLRLAIDDFGTGYSSLAYLKRLPVQELKIDKSFVMHMERDSDDAKIVRSTVDLAHNLGLSVVAEGVETASQWRTLRGLDCDMGQGYLIARPLPAGDFGAWMQRWDAHDARVLQEAPTTLM